MLAQNFNLLCVEDDLREQEILKPTLKMFFRRVYFATTITKGLEIYKNETIHVIFTDIKIINGNGLEFVKIIREFNYSIPIVILTNFLEVDFLQTAIPLNITRYIHKPLNFHTFKETVLECINRLNENNIILLKPNTFYDNFKRIIIYNNQTIELSLKETLLLELLIKNKNKITTKSLIEYTVYNDKEMTESAYKNLLLRFRKKLSFLDLKNVKDQGYILQIDQSTI